MIRETTALSLKRMMGESVVLFYFLKSDGSTREAYGTLSPRIIDAICGTPKGSGTPRGRSCAYFDIVCMQWRSFVESRLLGYDDDYGI